MAILSTLREEASSLLTLPPLPLVRTLSMALPLTHWGPLLRCLRYCFVLLFRWSMALTYDVRHKHYTIITILRYFLG